MVEKSEQNITKSLRVLDAKLYHYIVEELNALQNIHSYDIEIIATKEESGLSIVIRYAENYVKSKEVFLTYKVLETRTEELTNFINEVADDCKKAMVADYFKMMKP